MITVLSFREGLKINSGIVSVYLFVSNNTYILKNCLLAANFVSDEAALSLSAKLPKNSTSCNK